MNGQWLLLQEEGVGNEVRVSDITIGTRNLRFTFIFLVMYMRMYRRNFDELCNEILYLFAKMWHKKEWKKALFNLPLVKPFFLADSGYFPENRISEMRFRVIVPALLRRGMGGP